MTPGTKTCILNDTLNSRHCFVSVTILASSKALWLTERSPRASRNLIHYGKYSSQGMYILPSNTNQCRLQRGPLSHCVSATEVNLTFKNQQLFSKYLACHFYYFFICTSLTERGKCCPATFSQQVNMCIIHGSDADMLSYAHTNCMDEPVAACVSSMSGLEIYTALNVTQSAARTQTDSYVEANKNPTHNHHCQPDLSPVPTSVAAWSNIALNLLVPSPLLSYCHLWPTTPRLKHTQPVSQTTASELGGWGGGGHFSSSRLWGQ